MTLSHNPPLAPDLPLNTESEMIRASIRTPFAGRKGIIKSSQLCGKKHEAHNSAFLRWTMGRTWVIPGFEKCGPSEADLMGPISLGGPRAPKRHSCRAHHQGAFLKSAKFKRRVPVERITSYPHPGSMRHLLAYHGSAEGCQIARVNHIRAG